ncbi:MAG: carbohydrate kinase family protein [Candidatus Sungbacteria bacterium]|nr:carbohydrate kinase family protein [Candidatus Sungbacteria bacterium]
MAGCFLAYITMYDFIAIGDIVTDAFIRLKDASVHCDVNRERCEICMRFGDKIPYNGVTVVPAVGNSSNAAVAAARLGLKSALVTNMGDDYFGKECRDALESEQVSTEFIKIHQGRKTNYHYVLWYEDDRTILIKHEDYPYILPDIGVPRWVYLSSVGEHGLLLHKEIETYLAAHPEIKLAFQPGTYQMKFGKSALAGIYQRAQIFFCNKEEAQRILATDKSNVRDLLEMMHSVGPKIVVITDGPKGAYAYDGSEFLFMRSYPDPKAPFERTGAGDAFSSTVTIALALGMDLRTALQWGPVNSMSVVQQIGARAGLLARPELEDLLVKAPKDYTPVSLP